jgi:long-chain acyl-CoA synthetase
MTVVTMTTAHVRDPGPVIAAREAIEAEIAGGTLLSAFAETAERHADTEAYRWHRDGEWRSLTYAGLRRQVRDAALGLAAIGAGPGEFAVIWSRNRPEANIADLAVMHARGVPVFLYNALAPGQAAYIAGHCEATVAIVEDRGFLARLQAVRTQLPNLRRVVLIDDEPRPGEDWLIAWDSVLALGRAQGERSPGLFDDTWRRVGPDDLAALIYTSGTAGPPKGVMITHRNVRYCAAAVLRVIPPAEFADEAGRRGISYLPMAHSTGRFCDHWLPMICDATVTFCPDPAQLSGVAAQVRPTVLVGVPPVWEKLHAAMRAGIAAEPGVTRRRAAEEAVKIGHELARWRRRGEPAPAALQALGRQTAPVRQALLALAGLDACRLAVTGAAPIDPQVIEFLQALGLPVIQAWGMTELTGAATLSHPDRARHGAVGTACPGVEVRLAGDGEVLVRGPLVMRGYYRDLARTAAALDRDGWLHTGEVGTLDSGGFLTIVDRKEEPITTAPRLSGAPAPPTRTA